MHMVHPHHHLHIRKRIHQKHEPYPSPKPFIRYLDRWVSVLGTVTSLAVLPQVLEIWAKESAENISILTWGLFTIWSYTMLLYGVVHKARPIIITYILAAILNTMVVAGIFVF